MRAALVLIFSLLGLPAWAQQGLLPSQQPFDANGMSAGMSDNPNQPSGQLPSAIQPIIPAPTGNMLVDPNITMVAPTEMAGGDKQAPASASPLEVRQQLPEALRSRMQAVEAKVKLYAAELTPALRGSDGYLTLSVTGGAAPDRLQAAYSAWATSVEAVAPLELKAREPVFGMKMTLKNLKREVRSGQRVPVTLVFEQSGPVRVVAAVKMMPMPALVPPAAEEAVPQLPAPVVEPTAAQGQGNDTEKERGQPAPPPATTITPDQTIE